MSQPIALARPPAPPKNTLPDGVALSKFWRETEGGPIVQHDHERPIDETTAEPVGLWWMCPASDTCKTGEWVFRHPQTGEVGRPKKKFCSEHGAELLPGRSDPADDDPKAAARNWLQQRIAEKTATARAAARLAAQQRIDVLRAAGREEAARLRNDVREHVPSAGVSLGALVADWALLYELDTLPTYALGAGIMVGGTVLAYWAVYVGELVWARRMGYTLAELPEKIRARARSRARWIAAGVLSTGVWLVIAETIGAQLDNVRGILVNLMAAVMIGVVNYNPWAAMVARRQAEARARIEAAEAAARAEEERLAAEKADRERRAQEAEAARLAAEEAALAAARRIVDAEDDRITAGRKFAARWEQMAADAKARNLNPGFDLARTSIAVDHTRKLTSGRSGQETVIGWEFVVRGEPGVLAATRAGMGGSPFLTIRGFLSSMLQIDQAKIELSYEPLRENDEGVSERWLNHGVITLSEGFPLGENVSHPGRSGVFVDEKGVHWGFVGRDMRGQSVYRRHWVPGQAGGAVRIGITGGGKTVATRVTAYNDLLLGILPIIHDAGKQLEDFMDLMGVIPMGHTSEHRDIIRESVWAEMQRRRRWGNLRTAEGLGGLEVPADPEWDRSGGPPIRVTWEEFHMHAQDRKFATYLSRQVRLQRSTAIFAEGATQGGGLADWADQGLKEQMSGICMQLMRVSDHTATVSGYKGSVLPSDLPALPGMMVMQEFGGEAVPFRHAFIPRRPDNPDSLFYRLWQPNGTPAGEQILFAPELPAETVEVFRKHGLMDLWELGKTKSGREELINAVDPEPGPTVIPADLNRPAVVRKPKMEAADVVLAMLRHELETGKTSLTQSEMLASPWWTNIDGKWGAGRPNPGTVSRACTRLLGIDPQTKKQTTEPLIAEDAGKQYSLLPAGIERSEQNLEVLKTAGLLGQPERNQVREASYDIADLEREVLLQAEQMAAMTYGINAGSPRTGQ